MVPGPSVMSLISVGDSVRDSAVTRYHARGEPAGSTVMAAPMAAMPTLKSAAPGSQSTSAVKAVWPLATMGTRTLAVVAGAPLLTGMPSGHACDHRFAAPISVMSQLLTSPRAPTEALVSGRPVTRSSGSAKVGFEPKVFAISVAPPDRGQAAMEHGAEALAAR